MRLAQGAGRSFWREAARNDAISELCLLMNLNFVYWALPLIGAAGPYTHTPAGLRRDGRYMFQSLTRVVENNKHAALGVGDFEQWVVANYRHQRKSWQYGNPKNHSSDNCVSDGSVYRPSRLRPAGV
ncbi:MAG: hypothetical protein ACXVB0_14185 [Mucilaginibacter sp.]